MIDISTIQNQKLKSLIEDSFKFSSLPMQMQESIVSKINNSTPEQQEQIYVPFFERENNKENEIVEKREKAFENLIHKAKETEHYIIRTIQVNKENKDSELESKAEESLLEQINNTQ